MSKFSLIARLQHWMDSVPGQTFMNYAYSWGAAVVILGTLFKLTHIPGANLMLFIGMGTEVFVFFVSGFDRPFDAKVDNELADEFVDLEELEAMKEAAAKVNTAEGQSPAGGTVIIGGGAPASGTIVLGEGSTAPASGSVVIGGTGGTAVGGGVNMSAEEAAQLAAAAQAAASVASLGQEAQGLLTNAQAANAPEVEDAIEAYVDQLQQLTDVLGRVREQASRMTQDSEEMVNLNRTLTGINTIYEMQLKSVSQQVGTIDQINDQTRKMAKQIEELNGVYARMIEALTVNMPKNVQA